MQFFLLLVLLLSCSTHPKTLTETKTENLDAVLGAWDITVTGTNGLTYPSWVEFSLRREGELMARFVGKVGSTRYASQALFRQGKILFQVPKQYEKRESDVVFEGTLENATMRGQTQDDEGKTLQWSAQRSPLLLRAAPKKWGAATPIFNGKDLSGFKHRDPAQNCWKVEKGVLNNVGACCDLISEQLENDFKLHLEFKLPEKGNSGVYLRGRYEVQIQDGTHQAPDALRLGGVYGFLRPLMMAAKAPGEWQGLDITLLGRRITVIVNGTTVVENEVIPGITGGALDSQEHLPGPIMLQGDHTQVWFRNITLARPL